MAQQVLGIDIGGTGIKGAPVDVERGTLTADRYRLLTPQPAVPASVADVVAQVVAKFVNLVAHIFAQRIGAKRANVDAGDHGAIV